MEKKIHLENSEKKEGEAAENAEVKAEPPAKDPAEEVASKPEKLKKKLSFKVFMLAMFLPVLTSGIIRALGIFVFTTPNEFAPGGTNGIAVMLEYATGLNSGIYLLIINAPLFFVALFCIGKKEAILSTLSIVVSSGLLIILGLFKEELSFLQYGGRDSAGTIVDIGHRLLGAVAGGIFLGIALAIMIKSCGTSGGTTILASLVNKKFRNLSVSALTSAFDACVVFASIFVYNNGNNATGVLDPVLLALVSLYVTSKMSDVILQGFKSAYKFEIVTNHPEEIAAEIISKTHHSVTKIEAEGMYSHAGKSVLVCIIRKRQIAQLQRIIRKYPDTFAYFTPASEVYGRFIK